MAFDAVSAGDARVDLVVGRERRAGEKIRLAAVLTALLSEPVGARRCWVGGSNRDDSTLLVEEQFHRRRCPERVVGTAVQADQPAPLNRNERDGRPRCGAAVKHLEAVEGELAHANLQSDATGQQAAACLAELCAGKPSPCMYTFAPPKATPDAAPNVPMEALMGGAGRLL